ncbi:antibiotic biosynthesis monooxygenase [Streptomyces sp. NPDC000151]|uniref:putative quinol monooxygenase n=1 Tax=Streptomyces sp. NPDC000151 TaxID=3154244 RepID=UPI00331B6724
MLIVLSRARAAVGARDRIVATAVEMAAAARADPGCLAYTFAADLEDPDVIVCTELWQSSAALDAHMAHPHTAAFLHRVHGLTDGEPTLIRHAVTG